jgi:hypothetical protein
VILAVHIGKREGRRLIPNVQLAKGFFGNYLWIGNEGDYRASGLLSWFDLIFSTLEKEQGCG